MSVYLYRRSENNFVVGPGGQVALALTPNTTETPSIQTTALLASSASSSSLSPMETTSATPSASTSLAISSGSSSVPSAATALAIQSFSSVSSSVSSTTTSQSAPTTSASPSLTPTSNLESQNPIGYAGIALSIIVIMSLIAASVAWSIHLRRYRRNAGSEESILEKGEKAPNADQDSSIPSDATSSLRESIAFPLPIVSRTRTVPSRRSTNSTIDISTLAGSASPLKVVNLVPGDRSNATSRASTALGYNDETVGTPRAGITKPRFLSLRGEEGLGIPEGGLDFTRAFNDVARSFSSWSSDRNSDTDTFTSIPERRSRKRYTRSCASSCYTPADSSMVGLDRVEDSPNEIVGLPHAPLNPAPYRKERARSEASVEIGGHDMAWTRPVRIRSVSTEGSIHSS